AMARAAPPSPAATSSSWVEAVAPNGSASLSTSSAVPGVWKPGPQSHWRMVSGSGGAAGSPGASRAAMAATETPSASAEVRTRNRDVPAIDDGRSAARLSAGSAILPLPRRQKRHGWHRALRRASRSSAICGTAFVRLCSRWWRRFRTLAQPSDIATAQEQLDVARRLAQALAVLDQGNADVALAVVAESHARRHRDIGLLEQQLGESQAAHRAEALGQRRPGEHA